MNTTKNIQNELPNLTELFVMTDSLSAKEVYSNICRNTNCGCSCCMGNNWPINRFYWTDTPPPYCTAGFDVVEFAIGERQARLSYLQTIELPELEIFVEAFNKCPSIVQKAEIFKEHFPDIFSIEELYELHQELLSRCKYKDTEINPRLAICPHLPQDIARNRSGSLCAVFPAWNLPVRFVAYRDWFDFVSSIMEHGEFSLGEASTIIVCMGPQHVTVVLSCDY